MSTSCLQELFRGFQPPEQARFRKGFITIDHIHIPRQVIQNAQPASLLSVRGLRESLRFDRDLGCTAVSPKMPDSLSVHRSPKVFVQKRHYVSPISATDLGNYLLNQGVRQGIIICPMLFTVFTITLEDVFKVLDWRGQDIGEYAECITFLRFAEDIVIMADKWRTSVQCSMTPKKLPKEWVLKHLKECSSSSPA